MFRRFPRGGHARSSSLVISCDVAVAGLVSVLGLIVLAEPATAAPPIKTMSFNIRFDNGTPSTAAISEEGHTNFSD